MRRRLWVVSLVLLTLAAAAMAPRPVATRPALAATAAAASLATPAPPELRVEAPSALWGEAATLNAVDPARWATVQRLVGAHGTERPIRVLLVPEDDPLAGRTPRTISGFAVPEQDLVVLLPRRVPSYPYGSLEELLVHEVTHVLLARAAGGEPLPRWFHEGVALVAAHGWELADRGRLLLGGVGGAPTTTAAVERAFAGEQHEVDVAYVLAGAMVQELLRAHGRDTVAAVTAGVAAGQPFPDAFAAAAGEPLGDFETAFWRRFRLLYRWVPFLTSGATLWLGITLLALVAAARRRARDAAIHRRWRDEEWGVAGGGPAGDGGELAAGEVAPQQSPVEPGEPPAHESRWGPH